MKSLVSRPAENIPPDDPERRGDMFKVSLTFTGFVLTAFLAGCSSTAVEHAAGGAAAGAVSATFVGAMTDLIVDGRINTYRATRAAVGGAVAGGTAGAIAGQAKHEAEEKRKAEQAAREADAGPSAGDLAKEIGADNVKALSQLVQCRHEEAYRLALMTARQDNRKYQEVGLALQALVDRDRGNSEGEDRAVRAFVERSDELDDMAVAKAELEKLHELLRDERRVQGKNPECAR